MRSVLHDIYHSDDYPFFYAALVTNENPKALDRAEGHYSAEVTPSCFVDGGEGVNVGVGSDSLFRGLIEASGARSVPPLDLVTRMQFVNSSDVRISVSIGNDTPANLAPGNPSITDGVTSGKPDSSYAFTAQGLDSDADSLEYQISWGDGDTTAWLPGYASGDPITQSHTWMVEGDFDVQVRSRDVWQSESDWSTPWMIAISSSCCTGSSVGNTDGSADDLVTMGDLTVMIDHLFITLTPLACVDEGNVDLSSDMLVTMGDLTVLIDHLFITLSPLPACP